MKVKLIFLTALLAISFKGFAQNSTLKVGDQLPDLEINKILYRTPGKAKLSDFKGKLVILDFWSLGCSSCIDGMPGMDSLQKFFGNKIVILPVHPYHIDLDKHIRSIDSTWRVRPKLSNTSLPSILDNDFAKHFPARVGYQVWIDGNRVVRAITSPEYVNKKEIQRMLGGSYPQWESEIKENSWNKNVSEYLSRPGFSSLRDQNYSFFTTYIKGLDSHSDVNVTDSQSLISYKNCRIIDWYWKLMTTNGLTPMHIKVETKDSVRFFPKGYHNEWLRDNSFCYEMKLNRKVDEKTLAEYIKDDANKYFNLNGRIEIRLENCLIIVEAKKANKKVMPLKKNGHSMIHRSVEELFDMIRSDQNYLIQMGKGGLPIVNDVKSTRSLYLSKTLDTKNIEALRREMQSQGLDLIKGKRTLKMLVISKIN